MLHKQELAPNSALFAVYSGINFLPLDLDPVTGLALPASFWRRLAWKINFIWLLLFTVFLDVRLAQMLLLVPQYFNATHFPVHFIISSFLTLAVCAAYKFFIASLGSTIKIFNEVNNFTEV